MIYTNLDNLGDKYEFPKVIYDILLYFKDINLNDVEIGSKEYVNDERIKINTFEVTSISEIDNNRMSECHNKHVDIQFSVLGNEVYGFSPRNNKNELLEDRLEEEDALLFRGLAKEVSISANPRDVLIFFPNDVHRAYYKSDEQETSKRIVVKVPVELL